MRAVSGGPCTCISLLPDGILVRLALLETVPEGPAIRLSYHGLHMRSGHADPQRRLILAFAHGRRTPPFVFERPATPHSKLLNTNAGVDLIRTYNGKEFCGKAMVVWAHARGVQLTDPTRQTEPERLRRILQRPATRWMPRRALVPDVAARARRDRTLATRIQRGPTQESNWRHDAVRLCPTDPPPKNRRIVE